MLINKRTLIIISTVLLSVMLSGCATMFGDNTRDVKIDSNPQGAGVYIDGEKRGVTPVVVNLSTYIYGGKKIVLKKENYEDQVVVINSKFQPVSLWNLLNGFGFIIDALDGDIVKVDPASLTNFSDLGQPSTTSKATTVTAPAKGQEPAKTVPVKP